MPEIVHKMIGDFHVFTSPDIPGLYVADKNKEVAESRVQPTIDALARMAERKRIEHRVRSMEAA